MRDRAKCWDVALNGVELFVKFSNKTAQDVTVFYIYLEWEFLWMDHSRFDLVWFFVGKMLARNISICAYKLSIRPGFNEIRCAR